jgi:type IV pilus assembly protein PilF
MKMRRIIYAFVGSGLIACATPSDSKTGNEETLSQKQAKAAEINVQLGLGYFKQGDVQRAQKKLLRAREQAPNSADVAAALGYYFEHTGQLEQAKQYYGHALKLTKGAGAQLNNYVPFYVGKENIKQRFNISKSQP